MVQVVFDLSGKGLVIAGFVNGRSSQVFLLQLVELRLEKTRKDQEPLLKLLVDLVELFQFFQVLLDFGDIGRSDPFQGLGVLEP